MSNSTESDPHTEDRQWFIVRRWQTYASELRALLLRMAAVLVLYACHLIRFVSLSPEAQDAAERFHQGATAVAVLLLVVSFLVLLLILKRILPTWLPFLTTAIDLIAVAALVGLAGGPMMTSLTGAFYLIIAMAGLRFDLRLVWAATLGAMAGYLASVGMVDDSWFDANHVVPLVQQAVSLACIGGTGVVVGQMVRLARPLAQEYHLRVTNAQARRSE